MSVWRRGHVGTRGEATIFKPVREERPTLRTAGLPAFGSMD